MFSRILIGLRQTKAQRLLGYSSIGQMGLLIIAAALLRQLACEATLLFSSIGGLFVNHLFAKVGLFWLAGYMSARSACRTGRSRLGGPGVIFVFGILLAAISGFPPFPGFWAKWQLVLKLAAGERYVWIVIVLFGSLLEAAYLFRWFGQALHARTSALPRSQVAPAPGLRNGVAACDHRVRFGYPRWSHLIVGVHSPCRRTCAVPARRAAWAY